MKYVRALAAALFAACLLATGAASAQTYPDHPITLLVPFPPGGATDTIARILQDPSSSDIAKPPLCFCGRAMTSRNGERCRRSG